MEYLEAIFLVERYSDACERARSVAVEFGESIEIRRRDAGWEGFATSQVATSIDRMMREDIEYCDASLAEYDNYISDYDDPRREHLY